MFIDCVSGVGRLGRQGSATELDLGWAGGGGIYIYISNCMLCSLYVLFC